MKIAFRRARFRQAGEEVQGESEFLPAFKLRAPTAATLVEVLIAAAIVAILIALIVPTALQLRRASMSTRCMNSLRQMAAATYLYLQDHNNIFFPYYEDLPNGDRRWYFGVEAASSQGGPEGSRTIDVTQSPLYPYINSVGRVEVCPAFSYGSAYWKPKFKGPSYGYGYNIFLSPLRPSDQAGGGLRPTPISVFTIKQPSAILLFGDCAQINTFQPPASASNPLLEEFYFIDDVSKTVHFRHDQTANMLFVDGHVQAFKPWPGTVDTRIPGERVGRITARSSTEYLKP